MFSQFLARRRVSRRPSCRSTGGWSDRADERSCGGIHTVARRGRHFPSTYSCQQLSPLSTLTPLLLHSYFALTPLLLHSYSTLTPLLLHSHSTLTPLLFRPHTSLLSLSLYSSFTHSSQFSLTPVFFHSHSFLLSNSALHLFSLHSAFTLTRLSPLPLSNPHKSLSGVQCLFRRK